MSSFFNNEEQKMRAYKANLKKEAANQFKQGEKLQDYLLYQKGIETQETGLNKFAEAIGQKVGENVNIVGKVDKLKKTETLPSNAVVDEFGVSIKNVKKGSKSIKQPPKPKAMVSENPNIDLAKSFDANYEALFGAENRSAENAAMASEEALTRLSNAITAAATKREIDGMSAEDAISAFRELTDKEDAMIRQKFMNVLDEMSDKAKTQKNWDLINRIQDLIERQRLADAFDRLEENRLLMNDAFANKLQRNLKILLNEKRANRAINERKAERGLLASNRSKVQQELTNRLDQREIGNTMINLLDQVEENVALDMAKSKAATTIQKRMADLRALKAEKKRSMSESTDATELQSLAGVSKRGRPPTENLAAKRLAKYQELEAMQDKTKNQKKRMIELKRLLFRKPMTLEDKPEHRPTRGSNLRK